MLPANGILQLFLRLPKLLLVDKLLISQFAVSFLLPDLIEERSKRTNYSKKVNVYKNLRISLRLKHPFVKYLTFTGFLGSFYQTDVSVFECSFV